LSVTKIFFGDSFNQPINNCIPDSITHLKFGKGFKQSIANMTKTTNSQLTHLTISGHVEDIKTGNIPRSITHLTLYYNRDRDIIFEQIPSHVKVTTKIYT
jgi:hypothetical protein